MTPAQNAAWAEYWTKIQRVLHSSQDQGERDSAWFAVAADVAKNPHRYRRPVMPPRPANLREDDYILDAIRKTKRDTTERLAVALFRSWKNAVLRQEAIAHSRVLHLLRAVRALERIEGDGSGELAAMADELRGILEREWGWVRPVPHEHIQIAKLANALSINLDQMSADLRRGRRIYKRDDSHPSDNNEPTKPTKLGDIDAGSCAPDQEALF